MQKLHFCQILDVNVKLFCANVIRLSDEIFKVLILRCSYLVEFLCVFHWNFTIVIFVCLFVVKHSFDSFIQMAKGENTVSASPTSINTVNIAYPAISLSFFFGTVSASGSVAPECARALSNHSLVHLVNPFLELGVVPHYP